MTPIEFKDRRTVLLQADKEHELQSYEGTKKGKFKEKKILPVCRITVSEHNNLLGSVLILVTA